MKSRFKDRARTTWLKWVRLNEVPAAMQTESQELDANLLAPGEGNGIPKRWLGKLKGLRCFSEEASFGDIATGDRVMVRLSPDKDSSVAELVIIIKPTAYKRVSGTITNIEDMTITIDPTPGGTEGDEVLLHCDGKTTITLRGVLELEGQPAIAFYCEREDDIPLARIVLVGIKLPEISEDTGQED